MIAYILYLVLKENVAVTGNFHLMSFYFQQRELTITLPFSYNLQTALLFFAYSFQLSLFVFMRWIIHTGHDPRILLFTKAFTISNPKVIESYQKKSYNFILLHHYQKAVESIIEGIGFQKIHCGTFFLTTFFLDLSCVLKF